MMFMYCFLSQHFGQIVCAVVWVQILIQQKLILFLIMFTYDTFVSSLDRLSIKSTISGRTGTILGILGSIAFIVVCFVLFIGPVVSYFRGDYIQGIYKANRQEPVLQYSGCDFKLAIFFYQKSTNQLIDHTSILNNFDIKVTYAITDGQTALADVLPCSSDYFSQMNLTQSYSSKDCFIIPNQLEIKSSPNQINTFGFNFLPVCDDPFMCTGNSQDVIQNSINYFLNNHYYVLRFTAQNINQQGKATMKFYQMYSTQWAGEQTVIPNMYAILEKQKMYLDNSIMPWWNNITYDYMGWLGRTQGYNPLMGTISIFGTSAMIVTSDQMNIYFRFYKKLDWLLGMLGGGIFLIFLFFWIPCHTFAVIKQRVQQCQSIAIVQEENKISKTKFRVLWYLSNLLPFNLSYCFQKQRRIMEECQKFTDIVELIKKMKIAVKNTETEEKIKFQCRNLLIIQNQKKGFTRQQLKYELPSDSLQKIIEQPDIPKIYDNNLSMLTFYYDLQQRDDRTQVGQTLRNALQSQIYSKIKIPNFKKGRKTSCCADICTSFFSFIKNIIKRLDVFGAKPNLSAYPYHSSGIGCLFCLLICILSCLTCALTLANMGVTRTFWDQVYIPPQQQNITTTTGKQFKSLLCFSWIPFQYNIVVSPSREVDVKFYQYKRSQQQQSYEYLQTIVASKDGNTYFTDGQNLNNIELDYCFKPVDNVKLQVYGNSNSEQQAYVGYIITPYCRGTDQYCSTPSVINTMNENFYSLINIHPMWVFLPQNKYFPDQKQILTAPYFTYFSRIVNLIDLNFTQPMEQHIFMDTLELLDDRPNWITGNANNATRYLSVDKISGKSQFTMQSSSGRAFYRLKLSPSGKVQRIIFSNYKIDFLFAIIGGCFAFYYFFFGCLGKLYTNFQMRAKLAEILYDEDQKEISWIAYLLSWARIYCCQDEVIRKIQDDIDCIQLCKKVDTVYRLSCTKFKNKIEKDLSLIYLKQLIKQSQQVTINPYVQQKGDDNEDQNDNFQRDFDQANRNRNHPTRNAVANADQIGSHQDLSSSNESASEQVNYNYEECQPQKPTLRQNERFGKFINSFDFFHANSQFTLNGERQVRSVCGGISFLLLLSFIIILTLHFLYLYSSGYHHVSVQKIVDQNSTLRQMRFEGGKNFKFALSFIKYDDFNVKNVSSLVSGYVGISLIKYKSEKVNGVNVQSQIGNIQLTNCDLSYFDGFIDSRDSQSYYANFDKAYCVPDGTLLNLSGSVNDKQRQFFSLKIYNKGSTGLSKINELLSNYIPRFHISNPIVDYRKDGYIRYRMDEFKKYSRFFPGYSHKFNLTVTKSIIKYDTAVNPSNQKLSFDSYEFITSESSQYTHEYSENGNVKYELLFYPEEMYQQKTIKTIKINQLFGLIGGCIIFIFIGIGWIPRSFNQFKMRYMIGSKLYTILGRKKVVNEKKRRGKKVQVTEQQVDEYSQYSQLGLVGAWILSFWGFVQKNFNTNDMLRHYALIQSRVSNDINLFKFMKTLHSCQDAIKRKKLVVNQDLNLCKVHPKNIIYISKDSQQEQNVLISKILDNHQQLIAAAALNGFTVWELNKIVLAKENNVDISNIFKEKWLDDYFKVTRKTTQNSQSQLFSRTNSFRGMSQRNSRRSQRRSFYGSEKKSMIRQNSQIDKKEMKQKDDSNYKINQQYEQDFQERPRTSKSIKSFRGDTKLPSQFDEIQMNDLQ